MNSNERYKNKIITIPNILSMIRLILIPIMIHFYITNKDYVTTLIILFISGVTDIVDGFIARKFNMISNFGKALDPVADKLTQISMLFCLSFNYPEMIVPVILLSVKELVSGITSSIIIKTKKVVLGAVWHGKATTVIIYSMIFIHILWRDIPNTISNIFVATSILMMVYSCIMYMLKNIRVLKKHENS